MYGREGCTMTVSLLLTVVFLSAVLATLWAVWPEDAGARMRWERASRTGRDARGGSRGRAQADPTGRGATRRPARRHRLIPFPVVRVPLAGRAHPAGVSPRWVERALLRGGVDLLPAEFCLMTLVTALVGAGLGLLWGRPLLVLPAAAAGAAGPLLWLRLRVCRRVAFFERQLPDALAMIAGALRAGQSFLQAVDTVSREVATPLGPELARLVQETRVGVPVEEALQHLAERVGSRDLDLVVAAVAVQREAGGNLAQVIDRVSQTIRERSRLRGEIRTLTAQGRLSGLIIGSMPLGLGIVIWWLNPGYLQILVTSTLGRLMLVVSGVLTIVGFFIIRKLVAVDM